MNMKSQTSSGPGYLTLDALESSSVNVNECCRPIARSFPPSTFYASPSLAAEPMNDAKAIAAAAAQSHFIPSSRQIDRNTCAPTARDGNLPAKLPGIVG